MSVCDHSFGLKDQNLTIKTTPPYSVIETNVDHIEKAKVIVYLDSHDSPEQLRKAIAIIESLNPMNDIGLWENSLNSSPQELFPHLPLQWKEWEDADIATLFKHSEPLPPSKTPQKAEIIAKIRKQNEMLMSWKKRLAELGSNEHSIEDQKKVVNNIIEQAKHLGLNVNITFEKVLPLITCPISYQTELKIAKNDLTDLMKRIYDKFTKGINIKLFPFRQTSLINCIDEQLPSENRIHAFCGKSHGKMKGSPFPQDTERLITFLRSRTLFAIIDL